MSDRATTTRIVHSANLALYREKLPDPDNPISFNGLAREASSKGMRYVEALLYAIEQRRVAIIKPASSGPVFDKQP